MNFILMLTENDKTVPNCLQVLDEVLPLGLAHIGFKDIGVEPAVLQELTNRIKASGARCYLEVVSEDFQTALDSARQAVALGVDCLLGGSEIGATYEIIEESGMAYYPFAGKPVGHPTKLAGSPEEVAEHCHALTAWGVAGVDLLAYRAVDAEPLELIHAARAALPYQELIVAGSLESPDRLAAVKDAGADAFTMGTALFQAKFAPNTPGFLSQVEKVLNCLEQI